MIQYLLRGLRARLRGGGLLDALTVTGVALGVASVLSIQILNRNALGAFRGSVRAVSGEADLSVLGRLPTFPESIYREVLAEPGVRSAWPLVRAEAALADDPGVILQIVGFDLFAPVRMPFRGSETEITEALSVPGWVAVTPSLAAERGWSPGDGFEVVVGDRVVGLQVGTLVDFQRASPLASRKLAVMDLAQAQDRLGERGVLHQIDLQVEDGIDPGVLGARLEARLGPAVRVVTPAQRTQQAAEFVGAFRLNLTALSLISLFVGTFLVYGSVQASLVRRRQELGLLRSLGATRGQVVRLIGAEVAGVGLLGVAVGLPLGYAAAYGGMEGVSRTLSNLYLLEELETLTLPVWIVFLAMVVGVGGAMLGAVGPTLDMARRDTWSLLAAFTLHERAGLRAPRWFVLGAGLLGASAFWYFLWGRSWRPAGFVLALSLVVALPLMTPLVLRGVSLLFPVRGFALAFSLRSLGLRLQTTSVAVAALAVAVSMLVGITLMIGSFRETVDRWVRSTVRADLYVTGESWRRGADGASLGDDVVATLSTWPGVQRVDRLRRVSVFSDGRPVSLIGVDMGLTGGEARFSFLEGATGEALRRAGSEGAVLLGEPLARAAGVSVGDRFRLQLPDGAVELPVAGIYYDYSAGAGSAAVDLRTLDRLLGPGPTHSLALYVEPGEDPEQVGDALRGAFPDRRLRIRTNRTLRREVLAVFDQTFAVTRILQGMGLLIAVCGITLTLLVLGRAQVSELALYRALGARRRQIFRFFVGKGLGMAATGLALGVAGGAILAVILTFVINRSYFGWTLHLHWSWGTILGQAGAILAASVLASLYPALRASRTPASELSREEVA